MPNARGGRNALEILESAQRFFQLKDTNWHKGVASEAIDSHGRIVRATARDAVAWTPYGFILKVKTDLNDDWVEAIAWLRLAAKRFGMGYDGLFEWNTAIQRTHQDVEALFQQAIQACRANQSKP